MAHGANGDVENLSYGYTPDNQIASITSLRSAPLLPSSSTLGPADPANRIGQAGADTFTFDAEGQTLSDHNALGTAQYSFDARGRLTQVTLASGQTISYQYDALGRRVSRTANGTTTQFLYDDQEVVQDVSSDGSTINYLNGPRTDQKLRQVSSTNNAPLYFLQDQLASTVALTNAAGAVVESEQYDAYGGGNGSSLTRYLYTGRELDQKTALYFYRARYYDSLTGHFLSEDPKGLRAGVNFYEYALDNPVSFNDPFGLDVNFCYYPNAANGLGHVGFGFPGESSTQGFYPLYDSNSPWYRQPQRMHGPGAVKPDVGEGQYFCILIKTTPDQDLCLLNCRLERAKNPGTYDLNTRQCSSFVRDCFKKCKVPVGPYDGPYPEKLSNSIALAND